MVFIDLCLLTHDMEETSQKLKVWVLEGSHTKFTIVPDGGNLLFVAHVCVRVHIFVPKYSSGGMSATSLCQKMTNCPFSPLQVSVLMQKG